MSEAPTVLGRRSSEPHACTIIARNYLPAARVLARSFCEQHPSGRFSTLVIDDVYRLVDPAAEPFEVLRLTDVGFSAREVLELAAIYGVTELATAVKPWLLQTLLCESECVAYLDPDIKVFAPLDALFDLAKASDLVLTPHATSPMPRDGLDITESDVLAAGIYNLGFIAVGQTSGPFLAFWQERLRRDCIDDPEQMRFVDQRWVDFAPGMFDAAIVRDPTYNVAYWNLDHRELSFDGQRYAVTGKPLHFFHFSGYSPLVPHLLTKHQHRKPRLFFSEHPVIEQICSAYGAELLAAGYVEDGSAPYGYAALPDGSRIGPMLRRLYRGALVAAEREGGEPPPNPFDLDAFEEFLAWANGPAPRRRISRYLAAAIEGRDDLAAAYPDPDGHDRARFYAWARNAAGAGELDAAFVPDNDELLAAIAETPEEDSEDGHELERTPGIQVVGYFTAEMGVGQQGRLVVDAVRAAGIPYSTYTVKQSVIRQDQPFEAVVGNHNVNVLCVNADALPHVAWRLGDEFFAGHYNIGLWAWELEEFPAAFDRSFDLLDEVWGDSEFVRQAIARHTDKPVFAFAPPIVAPKVATVDVRRELGLGDQFVFLFCCDLLSVFERKNPLGLVRAFSSAFEPGEGPLLVIKTTNGDKKFGDLERLRLATARRPDVRLIDGYWPQAKVAKLIASADCYVSLHRSEGFGLTMAEAMALGVPVVATGYSGNLDFMTKDNAFLVDVRPGTVPKGCDPYPEGARWGEPNLSQAATHLRRIYDNPEVARAVGSRGQAHVERLHSPAARAAFLEERFAHAQEALAATSTSATSAAR